MHTHKIAVTEIPQYPSSLTLTEVPIHSYLFFYYPRPLFPPRLLIPVLPSWVRSNISSSSPTALIPTFHYCVFFSLPLFPSSLPIKITSFPESVFHFPFSCKAPWARNLHYLYFLNPHSQLKPLQSASAIILLHLCSQRLKQKGP